MTDFDRALDRLDATRDAFLARVRALSGAQRAFRPAPGTWSPLEIAEHVWRVERSTVRDLDRQVRAGDARRDVGPRVQGGVDGLERRMQDGMRIAMPEAEAPAIAPRGWSLDETEAAWRATAEAWRHLTVPSDLDGTGLVAHPIAGPLSPSDAARFAALHADHHGRQLDRVEASPGFPAA